MEREDERGTAKRPDLNELEVSERAEPALDKIERRGLLQRSALEMETTDNEPRQAKRSE
jgi:hypothetical protein